MTEVVVLIVVGLLLVSYAVVGFACYCAGLADQPVDRTPRAGLGEVASGRLAARRAAREAARTWP